MIDRFQFSHVICILRTSDLSTNTLSCSPSMSERRLLPPFVQLYCAREKYFCNDCIHLCFPQFDVTLESRSFLSNNDWEKDTSLWMHYFHIRRLWSGVYYSWAHGSTISYILLPLRWRLSHPLKVLCIIVKNRTKTSFLTLIFILKYYFLANWKSDVHF